MRTRWPWTGQVVEEEADDVEAAEPRHKVTNEHKYPGAALARPWPTMQRSQSAMLNRSPKRWSDIGTWNLLTPSPKPDWRKALKLGYVGDYRNTLLVVIRLPYRSIPRVTSRGTTRHPR